MNLQDYIKQYDEAVFDTDLDRALQVVHDAVKEGVTPEEVVFQMAFPVMDRMIKAVSEDQNANLAQHFLTARIADAVTAEMLPKFKKQPEIIGRVVMGTVWGDLHTLGKRIVVGCLKAHMIDVIDLGVNVPAERFVDEAEAREAPVIGLSALMIHTATGENGCRKVRRILRQRKLEDRIKIIVGGAPFRFHPDIFKIVGADTWAPDALTASQVIEGMLQEARR